MHKLLNQLDEWNFDVNVSNVPELESFLKFLKAALLRPKSITADFHFPKWNDFGRGSGQNREHDEYARRSRVFLR